MFGWGYGEGRLGLNEGGERLADVGEDFDSVCPVAGSCVCGLCRFVWLRWFVCQEVEIFLGEVREVGPFVLKGLARNPKHDGGEGLTYRKTRPNSEVFLDWRTVDTFQVSEGTIICLVQQNGVVKNVSSQWVVINVEVNLATETSCCSSLLYQSHHEGATSS